MKTTYTITEAQARLEGMLETLEIMANPEAMKAIARDRKGQTRYHPMAALDG